MDNFDKFTEKHFDHLKTEVKKEKDKKKGIRKTPQDDHKEYF